ncbi:unnamed protein product [Trichogramma brassicae]|uniref:Reverse transcriptase domain-containing protein n=1 Tax=Trichogramma brassicae TaxID=86971 RepID=A0A6H5IXT7_9HYME|nr:unnamed protein product [Trichogramma brassicae]
MHNDVTSILCNTKSAPSVISGDELAVLHEMLVLLKPYEEATKMISEEKYGLEITAANFDVAWEKLVRRYDNQRIRLYTALENLMQLPLVKSRTADELNNLITRTEKVVRSLQELRCPVHEYDHWIVHCVVRNLDANSCKFKRPPSLRSTVTWSCYSSIVCSFWSRRDHRRSLQRRPARARVIEAFQPTPLESRMHLQADWDLCQQFQRSSAYLPHHRVFRADNPSKIRVVFNASYKSSDGLTLNNQLLTGLKLQADITLVLSDWRFIEFAGTTDVEKMFRQIRVHEDDVDWQRVLWRASPTELIRDFRCMTVTYGTAAAPFLALRVMRQLAEDGRKAYP